MTLPVVGTGDRFPVDRVYCIGRNDAAHAIKMGHDPVRDPPFFFQKNTDNLDPSGQFPYPPQTSDVHHEVEMLVAPKSGGKNIALDRALDCVFGYGLSLDMTRRDLQSAQKKLGRPWEVGKAFEHSAPCGPIHPASDLGHPDHGSMTLTVNGELLQDGDLNQMIWKVPEMISDLPEYFELAAGDVILTGTPAGVAAVERGDVMDMAIEGFGDVRVKVI